MSDGSDQPLEQAALAGQNSQLVTGPFFQQIDWLSFGVTALVALAVYLFTLAPEVTLGYSGIVSTSAKYGGVAYPPGFPVWTAYSWLFANLLPVSNIAWRVAVGSAFATALAAGLVALMVSRSGAMLLENTPAFTARKPAEQHLLRGVCGLVAGMALGLSRFVWGMALRAETWAVSVLLYTALLCLLLRWTAKPERRGFLYAAAFVYGLLLTGNQELFVMLPAILAVALVNDRELGRDLSLLTSLLAVVAWALGVAGVWRWPVSAMLRGPGLLVAFVLVGAGGVTVTVKTRRVGSGWMPLGVCAGLFVLGLGWYLCLPFASMTNPPVNWAYARMPEGFFHQITRGQFEPWHPTDQWGRLIEQLWILGKEMGMGFGWLYLPFPLLPLGLMRRTGRCARNWLLGLAAALLCVGPLLMTLLNPPSADLASTDLIGPYFGPMDVVLALWTGLGLMVAGSRATKVRAAPMAAAMTEGAEPGAGPAARTAP
jgi:hypothetical protein